MITLQVTDSQARVLAMLVDNHISATRANYKYRDKDLSLYRSLISQIREQTGKTLCQCKDEKL